MAERSKAFIIWFNVAVIAATVALDVLLLLYPSLALKSAESVCFTVGACGNFIYTVRCGAKKLFGALMLCGCVFALAGDIVIYGHSDIEFTVGAALFAAAHVFYVAAYYALMRFRVADVIVSAAIAVPSVLFIMLAPVFGFDGWLMRAVCVSYAVILSVMVGKALTSAAIAVKNRAYGAAGITAITLAAGSVLFFASDFALLINMFAVPSAAARTVCLAAYYPAQFLLALGILTYGERGMNVYKTVFCRVFQFVLKLALPLLPYRDPVIIDRIADVPAELGKSGRRRPLIVTDKTVHGLGLLDGLVRALEAAGMPYSLYTGVVANPTTENVADALALYRADGCDCLIAVGGGSPMDCAKGVGALVARPNKTLGKLRGILKVLKRIPTLVAVPTTAGTGSETTLAAVIVDAKTRHKYAVNDFPLIPRYAVLDEGMTATCPKRIVCTTGMDALTHAVEAYIGRGGNRSTRADAQEAAGLIFGNIERAYGDGDAQSRKNMLIAAHKAGRAFSKAYVGYVHALAHALGGKYDIAHGYANAVILPVVLREYGAAAHKKLKELAVAAGIADGNASAAECAEKFIAEIERLNAAFGLPQGFTEIAESDIPELARHADKEANPLYPVPVLWDRAKLAEMYEKLRVR